MDIRSLGFALILCSSTVHAQDLSKQFPVKDAPRKSATKRTPRKKLPLQSQLALRTAFPTVTSRGLSGAITASDLGAARKAVGKNVLVVGTVSKVFISGSGSMVLLNFAKEYKSAVVGYIAAKDFGDFPALSNLKSKKVAISGKMILFRGQPEIELTERGSIKIVK